MKKPHFSPAISATLLSSLVLCAPAIALAQSVPVAPPPVAPTASAAPAALPPAAPVASAGPVAWQPTASFPFQAPPSAAEIPPNAVEVRPVEASSGDDIESGSEEGPPRRRRPGLIVAGASVMGTGLLISVVGLVAKNENKDCEPDARFLSSCGMFDRQIETATTAMLVGGLITLVAGIPMLIMGVKKRPVSAAQSAWVGQPTANGWSWKF